MPDKVYAPSTIRARLAMIVLLIGFFFIGLPTFIAMPYVPAYVREMDRLLAEEFERRLLEDMREEDMRQPEGPIRVVMDRERGDAMVQIRRNLARGLDPQGNPLAVPIPVAELPIFNGRMRLILMPQHGFDRVVAQFNQLRAAGHFPQIGQEEVDALMFDLLNARARLAALECCTCCLAS